jgi:arginine decarboxylase
MSTGVSRHQSWDPSRTQPIPTLTIRVSRGMGSGPTPLAAFDEALRAAGVADFNLVRLSSIIPPGAVVRETAPAGQIRGGFGDLLYAVYADAYTSDPGQTACAGVTWARAADGSGSGLFAEYAGSSPAAVTRELQQTMATMTARRTGAYQTSGLLLEEITCDSAPVCAVVIASYRAVSWRSAVQA